MSADVPGELRLRRLERWHQTPETRIPDSAAAHELIDQLGIVTLYPASPEVPNLFHAFVGDPAAKTEASWDSPSGQVYGWRWDLGRARAGFYTAIVRGRPTWVSWTLLPAMLRLLGDQRTPDELYSGGELSDGAYRIAQTLEASGGVLSTGELRREAGFPTGKAERAAYLKAVDELDTRLMLAKVFSPDDTDMRHALVTLQYPEASGAAEELSRAAALDQLMRLYLPRAGYALPALLARHLKLPEAELRASLDQLVAEGAAQPATFEGIKGQCYTTAE